MKLRNIKRSVAFLGIFIGAVTFSFGMTAAEYKQYLTDSPPMFLAYTADSVPEVTMRLDKFTNGTGVLSSTSLSKIKTTGETAISGAQFYQFYNSSGSVVFYIDNTVQDQVYDVPLSSLFTSAGIVSSVTREIIFQSATDILQDTQTKYTLTLTPYVVDIDIGPPATGTTTPTPMKAFLIILQATSKVEDVSSSSGDSKMPWD